MLTVFTAKYTSKNASGGTLTLLMQASHCFDYFLFGRQVVLFPVWTHAIDTLQTEIPKYKMKI
jgi:hypothetical protein